MINNRIQQFLDNGEMGNNGFDEPSFLSAFSAEMIFCGKRFGIVVYGYDWPDARAYCQTHGLKLTGKIEGIY